jgi:hypothetical protein
MPCLEVVALSSWGGMQSGCKAGALQPALDFVHVHSADLEAPSSPAHSYGSRARESGGSEPRMYVSSAQTAFVKYIKDITILAANCFQ